MPTIKDKLYFNFNGVSSRTYGLIHVVLDNGMYEETLVANREINETTVRGQKKPLFHDIEEAPLEFDMVLAFENGYTDQTLDSVIQWLFVDYYKPLFFESKEDKIYYCMPAETPSISHNGLNQGYITIKMRCDSPNLFSPTTTTPATSVVGNATLTLQNAGHFDIYPEISILKKGAGHIVIESLDDGGNIFEIRDLTNLEDIYINCEKEIIETDIIGVYRYDNIIGHFPRLLKGSNRIKITGDCDIQFKYKNRFRF